MDPLGARSQFLDVQTLPGWDQPQEGGDEADGHRPRSRAGQDRPPSSPFPHRDDINRKIILFNGDVALLNCTAIVNTSNETLTDKNPVADSIHRHAGPELKEELLKLKGCRTGEAKMTKGFNLAARFIIHTVGPKYKAKYRTAAESSLYNCYRNVMQLAKEQGMASVAFCVINTVKRGYPLEDATHIAFSKKRQCLSNRNGRVNHNLIFPLMHNRLAFLKLLSAFFPLNQLFFHISVICIGCLKGYIGRVNIDPMVRQQSRKLKKELPSVKTPPEDSEDESLDKDLSFVGSHAFARMEGDVDKQRKLTLQGQMSEATQHKQHLRNYNRWLCRARAEDLSDIAALKALYQTGVDTCGRTVMVVVGRNIPVTLIDMEKALLYFIHVMDHITVKEYVMVYFHTLTNEHNHLDSEFLKKLYDIVDVKYKKNLKAFYFVHPTFRSKISAWFFTTFSVSGLKDKVHHVETLQQLFTCVVPEQIDIPPFVLEYEARVNGPQHSSCSSGL
uniref:Ganglioside induced differentiation associated protein 2 n=1 Tax=Lepisosteus oculatus TaxID=7918 RepID=W5MYZ8_LEPOC